MAVLENIELQPMRASAGAGIKWKAEPGRPAVIVPQIFFSDGSPWREANTYALSKIQGIVGSDPETVRTFMNHLRAYASWLEDNKLDWRHFPRQRRERCLFRFRGFLISQRDNGVLAASTVSSRMGAVIRFYRWAIENQCIKSRYLWEDKIKSVNFYSLEGLSRSFSVSSSELSIPNRSRPISVLEDGLLPLTTKNREVLISLLRKKGLEELYLMVMLGCFTGARSETIRTLRIDNIEQAIDDPSSNKIKKVPVGPGTRVKTKYDVSGSLLIPDELIKELLRYAYSIRRLKRQAKASNEDKALLFLTKRGNKYTKNSFTKIISDLRVKLVRDGFDQFHDFKFHQTRATFGTQLMRIAMDILPTQSDAIIFVRDAMLHEDEATTWGYVKFIEAEPVKEKLSEEFFHLFTGKIGNEKS